MATERKVIKKRRFPRRKFKQVMGLLFRGAYDISQSVQIGEGGMLIRSPHAHKDGEKVVISFLVPGRGFMIVRAQIQYSLPDKKSGSAFWGVKFLNLSFENRRILRDFISAKTEAEALLEGVYQ